MATHSDSNVDRKEGGLKVIASGGSQSSHSKLVVDLVISTRPKQYKKNLLVFLAPLAAGTIFAKDTLLTTITVAIIFLMASSATYLLNDILDFDLDKNHPVKSKRPIAAGRIKFPPALICSALFAILSIYSSYKFVGVSVGNVVLIYLSIQLLYVFILKHQPVLDLACVASGFVLRAIAGALACDLMISGYFVVVVGATAMFVVSGKRYSELKSSRVNLDTRPSLSMYSLGYLRFVWSVSVSISFVFYVLWAMEISKNESQAFAGISFIPFAIVLLRYAQDIDAGNAEAPEDIVSKDLIIKIASFLWVLLFGARFI